MRYLSLFSGIEAATAAWHPLGWTPVAFAEIDKLPCKVLAHRFPSVPNLGDVTKISELDIARLGDIDAVIFGSPCQDLSVAGKRKGLAGERSGLFYDAMRIIRWAREWCGLRWALWENVPGVFTSNAGADFAVVVGEMGGGSVDTPPKGWGKEGVFLGPEALVEWSTLDAQWFGVAQRRRRVFVIADFGDWASRPPVLLEPASVRGDSAPSREARQSVAGTSTTCLGEGVSGQSANAGLLQLTFNRQSSAQYNNDDIASTVSARDFKCASDLIAFSYNAQAAQLPSASRDTSIADSLTCSKGAAVAFADTAPTLAQGTGGKGCSEDGTGRGVPTIAQFCDVYNHTVDGNVAATLNAESGAPNHSGPKLITGSQVRRLTPVECERLQGFPDNWTLVGNAADGPRYKALGNSMAVPVINWIGRSIEAASWGVWA